jgi:hypothetical protein
MFFSVWSLEWVLALHGLPTNRRCSFPVAKEVNDHLHRGWRVLNLYIHLCVFSVAFVTFITVVGMSNPTHRALNNLPVRINKVKHLRWDPVYNSCVGCSMPQSSNLRQHNWVCCQHSVAWEITNIFIPHNNVLSFTAMIVISNPLYILRHTLSVALLYIINESTNHYLIWLFKILQTDCVQAYHHIHTGMFLTWMW